MNIAVTQFSTILSKYPECMELLWPYKNNLKVNMTPNSFAIGNCLESKAVIAGLERIISRVDNYKCDFESMREHIIKPNAINIAGYIDFSIQKPLIDELNRYAKERGMELNINIFPKHEKKIFQNYLLQCNSPKYMPDILIGKGFSSLNTALFIEKFIHTGIYKKDIDVSYNNTFKDAGFFDPMNHYHTFGAEEYVMVIDKTKAPYLETPTCWSDLQNSQYENHITQMGQSNDQFGFVMMFYLFAASGLKGVRNYVKNVKDQIHYTEIVKHITSSKAKGSFINMMHRHANTLIDSEASKNIEIIDAEDGNPTTAYFFLLKEDVKTEVTEVAQHLFSEQIGSILEQSGIIHAALTSKLANKRKLRWIGWPTLKTARLPYLKEHLSTIARKSVINYQS